MLEFRLASQNDEAFLKTCIQEAYTEFPRLIAAGEKTLLDAANQEYERLEDGFAHIAMQNGSAVGAAWWAQEADPTSVSVAYYVDPEVRGQGVATQLIEVGLEEARRRGFKSTVIKTHPDNAASIALAKKLGYAPVVALLRQSL